MEGSVARRRMRGFARRRGPERERTPSAAHLGQDRRVVPTPDAPRVRASSELLAGLLSRVGLQPLPQLLRTAQCGGVPPVDLVEVMPRRVCETRRRKLAGNKRSSRQSKTRVGTSGHAFSGHGPPFEPRTGRAPASVPRRQVSAERPGRTARSDRRTVLAPAPRIWYPSNSPQATLPGRGSWARGGRAALP